MRFEKKTFTSESIELDGNEFIDCAFDSCTFVFAGHKGFAFRGNRVSSDCGFRFTECAANTVATMQAIYGMGPWGQAHIIATFHQIAPDLKHVH
jgi:hypothetical protein